MPVAKQTAPATTEWVTITLTGNGETKGTVKFLTDAASDAKLGGRPMQVYIPKDAIKHIGGLTPQIEMTIRAIPGSTL